MALERIIVPVDFSDHAAAAAELAVALARHHGAGVTLLHVDRLPGGHSAADPPAMIPAGVWESYARERSQALTGLLEAMRGSLDADVRTDAVVVRDETSTAIINEARKCEANLVVMGSHGADAPERFLLGSVAAGVAAKSTCPVLITRGSQRRRIPATGRFEHPLLAVDDEQALVGVGAALRLLAAEGATIDLGPGWADSGLTEAGVERKLALAADSRELAGFDTHQLATTRRPAAVLLDRLEAADNDLVIVPARSQARDGLLGVIADRLLHYSPVPVLIPAQHGTAQDS